MFEATGIDRANRKRERLVAAVLLAMTLVVVLPVVFILGVLIVKGSPVVSFAFLFTEPR